MISIILSCPFFFCEAAIQIKRRWQAACRSNNFLVKNAWHRPHFESRIKSMSETCPFHDSDKEHHAALIEVDPICNTTIGIPQLSLSVLIL
jgi:hypothetical protein